MYCECGSMRDARKVFTAMQKRDVFSWNFMIKACSRHGLGKEALQLFEKMQREALIPDHFILASAISACASQMVLIEGERLHACVIGSGSELDSVLGTALINLYGKCGCPVEALEAFDRIQKRDVVAWTAIIDAYHQAGAVREAFKLYVQMQREEIMPDRFIIISMLVACASQAAIEEGKEMHANIRSTGFESDVLIGNALIDMYGKCNSLEDAEKAFANIPEKDVVSWNTMIVAYAENGRGNCALKLFEQMQYKGVKPDLVTFVSIFTLCASLGAVVKGISVVGTELESDSIVRTAIISMYGKCDSLQDALDVFNKSPKQHVSLWNALLAAHAHSSRGRDAVQIFQQMQSEGVLPNKHTYVILLAACGHAGLPDEGCGYFESMTQDYGISPTLEHYNCMIYLLGRARRLSKAVNLIGRMLVEPNTATCLTLLGACRNLADVKGGERVAKHLFGLIHQSRPNHPAVSRARMCKFCGRKCDPFRGQWSQKHYSSCPETLFLGKKNNVSEIIAHEMEHIRAHETCTFAPSKPAHSRPRNSRMIGSGLMYQEEPDDFTYVSNQLLEQKLQSRNSSQLYRALNPNSIHGSIQNPIAINGYHNPSPKPFVLSGCLQGPNPIHVLPQDLDDPYPNNFSAIRGWHQNPNFNALNGGPENCNPINDWHPNPLNPTSIPSPIHGWHPNTSNNNAEPIPDSINVWPPNTNLILDQPDHPSPRLSRSTYPSLLRFCGNTKSLSAGKQIHDHIVRNGHDRNLFLTNLLLQMYCECGSMRDARKVFTAMQKRDVFSWNFMIKACSRHGLGKEALQLFEKMQREALIPDHFILASVISACASQMVLMEGKRLHACVIGSGSELDSVLGTALINLYGKCGCPVEALEAFDRIQKRDVVAWTAIIDAYHQAGAVKEALKLYVQMQREEIMPDRFIIISMLVACASQAAIEEGKEMHANIRSTGFESDVLIGNALIDMYGKCNSLEDAEKAFANIPEKDVVSWNTMIVAYAENGRGNCALKLFEQMQYKGVKPDLVTFVSIFTLCASLGAVVKGKGIHLSIVGTELESDSIVRTAIISMYGKCGSLQDALDVFNKSPKQHVSLWNALLAAHAYSSRGRDAVQIFQQMQSEGVLPNKHTYVSLLAACGHAGLVDEGCGYFESMTQDYGISPTLGHYNCMIYLLGRARRLSEAVNLIGRMLVEPNTATWLILLGACRNLADVKRGERVAKHLFGLIPNNAAPYIMLFHLYLAAKRQVDAADVINLMRRNKEIKEIPGCSSIEVKGLIHVFLADDQSHPQKEEIYAELTNLNRLMAEMGIKHGGNMLLDTLEGEHHNEMIATAFGLINTAPKSRIFVTKNLRMCSECHTALKLISQVTDREIVLRDADCLHLMKDGVCSCADYW